MRNPVWLGSLILGGFALGMALVAVWVAAGLHAVAVEQERARKTDVFEDALVESARVAEDIGRFVQAYHAASIGDGAGARTHEALGGFARECAELVSKGGVHVALLFRNAGGETVASAGCPELLKGGGDCLPLAGEEAGLAVHNGTLYARARARTLTPAGSREALSVQVLLDVSALLAELGAREELVELVLVGTAEAGVQVLSRIMKPDDAEAAHPRFAAGSMRASRSEPVAFVPVDLGGTPRKDAPALAMRWDGGPGHAALLRMQVAGVGSILVFYVLAVFALARFWKRACQRFEHALKESSRSLEAARDELRCNLEHRDKAQEALHAAREKLERVLDGSHDGFWDWDMRTGKVSFSARYFGMLGYPEKKREGGFDDWLNLIHPDDRAGAINNVEAYLAGEKSDYESTFRALCEDGSVAWVLARGRVWYDAEGRAVRMAGSHTDITRKKLAQEELRANRNFLRAVVSNLPLGVFVKAASGEQAGRITLWNPAAEAIFGVSAEDCFGKRFDELFEADWVRVSDERDRESIATGNTLTHEEPVEIVAGARRVVRSLRMPLPRADGAAEHLLCIFEDVTVRREGERDLFRFKETLDRTADGVILLDASTLRIFYANAGFRDLLGYRASELGGLTPASFTPSLDEASWRTLLEPLARDCSQHKRFETVFQTKSGRNVDVELSLQHVEPHEESPRYVAILRDISERRALEMRLRESMNHVEALNEDLLVINETLEKAIERANQMTCEAEKANSAKSRFIANVSHDIRTPLNGIVGFLPLIEKGLGEGKEREYLESVRESVEVLLALIQDLLDLSRAEAGTITLQEAPVQPESIARSVLTALKAAAGERGVHLILREPPHPLPVLVTDKNRLKQVLFNLVGNAVKFTPEGEVSVEMRVEALQAGRARLHCQVADTGLGIRAADLKRIFDPFSQVEEHSASREGTGLGLSICQSVCRLLGGDISASSVYGEGSVFSFHIECQVASRAEGHPAEEEPAAAAEVPASYGDLRVLVVDDSPINRAVMLGNLEALGCEAQEAGDGQEAVEAVAASTAGFSLIFMDIRMPVLNGEDATRQIRALPCFAGSARMPRIVALSAEAPDTGSDADSLFDEYLLKPVNAGAIEAVLARASHGGRAPAGIAGPPPA